MNYQRNYYPRRPVKSFQDLEVYQKVLAAGVMVIKRLMAQTDQTGRVLALADKLIETLMKLPVLIAGAHSIRFSHQVQAVAKLEEAMLNCNLAVVYLEQYRDIFNTDIEVDFFAEQIKILLSTRIKILHLQRSWVKFAKLNEGGKNV